jgi:hypothetical protein
VHWNRNVDLGAGRVKKTGMAPSLMVNIESAAQERCDYLPWFENRQLGRHAGRLRDGDRNPLSRDFRDVTGNWFTCLQSALQEAADGVPGHLPGFF